MKAHTGKPNLAKGSGKAIWRSTTSTGQIGIGWRGWRRGRARGTVLGRGNVGWMSRWVNLALNSELASTTGQHFARHRKQVAELGVHTTMHRMRWWKLSLYCLVMAHRPMSPKATL